MRLRTRALAAALAGALLGACGWHAGLVLPEGSRTIGIEVFDTAHDLRQRNLEPLVAPGRADIVLRGKIQQYRRRTGVRDVDNRLIESGLLIAITAELVDRRTGKVLRVPSSEHVGTGYLLGDDALAHEADARERSIEHIAESLVLNLFGPQPPPAP